MTDSHGLVRRVDDLGRVVIPREMRRVLDIREGDPLVLSVDLGAKVLQMRKYFSLETLGDRVQSTIDILRREIDCTVAVVVEDHVVASSGPNCPKIGSFFDFCQLHVMRIAIRDDSGEKVGFLVLLGKSQLKHEDGLCLSLTARFIESLID